jgi:hypothetical protein
MLRNDLYRSHTLKVFLMSVIAILAITVVAQYTVTHFAGESSEAAYSDRSTRP